MTTVMQTEMYVILDHDHVPIVLLHVMCKLSYEQDVEMEK